MIQSINPYNQEVLATYQLLSATEIEAKLNKSKQVFNDWRYTSLEVRKQLFRQLAILLRQRKTDLALLITLEMGKILRESEAEIVKCAETIDYYVEHVDAFLADVPFKTSAHKTFVSFEPIGTVLAVMPWNFPFWQVLRFAIPTLLAGNVGVLKHASNVMGCAEAIEQLFVESGFPEGVFLHLRITSRQVDAVIKHPAVKAVTLTGSELAGVAVATAAASVIKKSVLELGGSDPFVVLKDADIQKAAKEAVRSRFRNAGQTCIAAKRWIIEKEVKDEFTAFVLNETNRLHQGNPLDEATDMGPMAKLELTRELDEQLKNSIASGGVLLQGGGHNGCNYEPTIVENITAKDITFREETFGPLGCIIEAKDEAEAIRLANDTAFGLGASVWTKDLEKGEHLARQLEAGAVHLNSMVKSDAAVPFGGTKRSGYGRELSYFGMYEFLNIKTIWIESV